MSERNLQQLEREIAALREALAGIEARRERAWHRRVLRQLARPRVRFALAALIVSVPLVALAVTVPNLFVNGTIADADDVNANFLALENSINLHEPDASAHHSKTTNAGELTSGTLADTRLSTNVSLLGPDISTGELDFDAATQLELNAHALVPSAHHVKTVSASELTVGTLADARLSANVSLLGPGISTGELAFDTATQLELNSHEGTADAHHPVVPNRILVAALGGDFTSIQSAINSVTPTASKPYEILIAPGLYKEKLVMKSHLRLLGTSREGTVLEVPDGNVDHVVLTSLESVEISRLTLRSEGGTPERALRLLASELFLSDVRVEAYGTEFVLAESGSVLNVERSEFLDPFFQQDRGVFIRSSQATITTSVFETVDCAIEASTSALTLTNSEVLSRQVCAYGNAATPQPVMISQNRLVSVDIDGNVRAKIVGNEITSGSGGGGVRLDSSEPAQFVGNSLTASDTIPLSMTGDVEVLGNRITATGPHDAVTNFASASIVGNWIASSFDAVQDTGNARILGNTITAGGINESTSSLVMGNRVTTLPSAENWQNPGSIDIESTADDIVLSAGGSSITLSLNGDITIQSVANLTLTSGGKVTINASNEIELNAAAEVDVNSGMINLN